MEIEKKKTITGRSSALASLAFLVLVALIAIVYTVWLAPRIEEPEKFDGQRAYQDVIRQVEFGPRIPGSEGHSQAVDWMMAELQGLGWDVEIQETSKDDMPIRNLVAKRGGNYPQDAAWIILGAHYDTRMIADRDPSQTNQSQPVPGGNDGASGVSVLMELARVLPDDSNTNIWLLFFDAEDQGGIGNWDWSLGADAFVSTLEGKPDAVVIVDMVGDADLNIYKEINSDVRLIEEIFRTAAEIGYQDVFIPEFKHRILDDHIPFLKAGIAAVDLIDIEYTYWHTVEDTADKVAPESLQAVGDVLLDWLELY